MISGKYIVSLDGHVVAESPNIITDSGRIAILRFLAGISNTYAGILGVGISDAEPSPEDKELGYEVYQAPILLKSVDYGNAEILFKATFPIGDRLVIREIGLFPDEQSSRGNVVTFFDSPDDWSGTGELNVDDIRMGEAGIVMEPTVGSSTSIISDNTLNLIDVQNQDEFVFAVILYDDGCEYIRLTFQDVDGNTMVGDFTPEAYTSGSDPQYCITSLDKGSFSGLNSRWGQIVKTTVTVKANAAELTSVVLDGLRTSDSNILTGSEIVSKTLLAEPVIKEASQTLDVQYSLSVPI